MSQDDDGLEPVYADRTDPSGQTATGRVTPTQATPAHAISGLASPPGGAGSVVVDPTSQVPPAPGRGSRASQPAVRRQAEATLVLEGRKVDELRREILRQQQKLKRKKGAHIVWWAFAGALAVLAGGWIASGGELGQRLLGQVQGAEPGELTEVSLDEAPSFPSSLQPNAHERTEDRLDELTSEAETDATPASEAPDADGAIAAPVSATAARAPGATATNDSGTKKKSGDWGDGLDQKPRPADRNQKSAQSKAASRALSLDDLEEERLAF